MDVTYHNSSLTDSIPLFRQGSQPGRFLIEMDGFLSFLQDATVNVLVVQHEFNRFEVAEQFTLDNPPVVVVGAVNRTAYYSMWYSDGAGGIVKEPEAGRESYEFKEWALTLSNGANIVVVPTLTIARFPTQFPGVYNGVYMTASDTIGTVPAVGQPLSTVLANGWVDTAAGWFAPF